MTPSLFKATPDSILLRPQIHRLVLFTLVIWVALSLSSLREVVTNLRTPMRRERDAERTKTCRKLKLKKPLTSVATNQVHIDICIRTVQVYQNRMLFSDYFPPCCQNSYFNWILILKHSFRILRFYIFAYCFKNVRNLMPSANRSKWCGFHCQWLCGGFISGDGKIREK